ncbi:MAG: NAD regulator [Caulobacterales bacterium]|nr:NAD regulator [Caulobacterales bacterium]
MTAASVVIGLTAVIFAVDEDGARVLVVKEPSGLAGLPFGPFDPEAHRTFELALRAFVRAQTGFKLGYVEQLYTFGDRGREAPRAHLADREAARVISVSYVGLAPEPLPAPGGAWADWYRFFPWEDHRAGRPAELDEAIAPRLRAWADAVEGQGRRAARWTRARAAFGLDGAEWNEERALDRYELLYEADLAPESAQDARRACGQSPASLPPTPLGPGLGEPMGSDHRRILATAVQRLRGKIKYRPVLFELLPDTFTLSELQRAAETVLGAPLHKQNFRRALAASRLVEPTGRKETATGGRPAELHRFRREALRDRPALGVPAPRQREG